MQIDKRRMFKMQYVSSFFCFWVAKVKQGVISRFTRCVSLHPSVSLGSCPINVPHVPSTTKSLLFRYPKDEFCQKKNAKRTGKDNFANRSGIELEKMILPKKNANKNWKGSFCQKKICIKTQRTITEE